MKRVPIALLLLAAAAAPGVFAKPESEVPTIATTGEASVNVVPDEVEIVVGVERREKDLAKVRGSSDRVIANLIAVARAHGVDARHVQSDYIDLQTEYDSRSLTPDSYVARKSITITTRDLSGFESLLSALLDAGANRIISVRFASTQVRRYRDQARRMAARAATEKAQLLAESLGRHVGKARSISEGGNGWGTWSSWWGRWSTGNSQNSVATAGPEVSMGSGSAVAPGQISITATVNVTFELQ